MFTCPPLLFDRHACSGEITNLYLRRLLVLAAGAGVDTSVRGDSVVKRFPYVFGISHVLPIAR